MKKTVFSIIISLPIIFVITACSSGNTNNKEVSAVGSVTASRSESATNTEENKLSITLPYKTKALIEECKSKGFSPDITEVALDKDSDSFTFSINCSDKAKLISEAKKFATNQVNITCGQYPAIDSNQISSNFDHITIMLPKSNYKAKSFTQIGENCYEPLLLYSLLSGKTEKIENFKLKLDFLDSDSYQTIDTVNISYDIYPEELPEESEETSEESQPDETENDETLETLEATE